MTRCELADVYRRAAKIVEKHPDEFSCLAVRKAVNGWGTSETIPECRLYIKTMGFHEVWPGYSCPITWTGATHKDIWLVRVMMLLLMAEWVLTDWNGEKP